MLLCAGRAVRLCPCGSRAAPSHPTFEPLLCCTHSLYCLLPSKEMGGEGERVWRWEEGVFSRTLSARSRRSVMDAHLVWSYIAVHGSSVPVPTRQERRKKGCFLLLFSFFSLLPSPSSSRMRSVNAKGGAHRLFHVKGLGKERQERAQGR